MSPKASSKALAGIYSHIEPHPGVCSTHVFFPASSNKWWEEGEGGTRHFCFFYPPKHKVKTGSKRRLVYCRICCVTRQCWDLEGMRQYTWDRWSYNAKESWKNMHKPSQDKCFSTPAWCHAGCWLDGCTHPWLAAASTDPASLSPCSKSHLGGFCHPCPASRSEPQQLDHLINHLISGCFV